MSEAGSLSTISIAESDLLARVPSLSRLRDARAVDWSAQIVAGATDALVAFRQLQWQDPAWCVPDDAAAWKRILVFFTLAVIYQPMLGLEYEGEFEKWTKSGVDALGAMTYRVRSERRLPSPEDKAEEVDRSRVSSFAIIR